MMSSSIKILSFVVCMLTLVACEKDANIDLPETKSKVVLRCFISPQDTEVVARVTRSEPIFGDENIDINQSVNNAVVHIKSGTTEAALSYDYNRDVYVIPQDQFPIVEGIEYTMSVFVPGTDPVEARTTIPSAAPQIIHWDIEIADTTGVDYDRAINLNGGLFWKDPYGDSRFVSVQVTRVEAEQYFGSAGYTPLVYETFYKKMIEQEPSAADKSLNLRSSYWSSAYIGEVDTAYFELYLMHVSEDYYRFNLSMENAGYNDPFTEPSFVYSNVSGGLGVFAGYNGVRSVLP